MEGRGTEKRIHGRGGLGIKDCGGQKFVGNRRGVERRKKKRKGGQCSRAQKVRKKSQNTLTNCVW